MLIDIFSIDSEEKFREAALEIFSFQAKLCVPYKNFLLQRKIDADDVYELKDIPFLPIEFFKRERIIVDGFSEEEVFTSSGTTQQQPINYHSLISGDLKEVVEEKKKYSREIKISEEQALANIFSPSAKADQGENVFPNFPTAGKADEQRFVFKIKKSMLRNDVPLLNSHHYVADLSFYETSFLSCFEKFYGDVSEYCILALLPSYADRSGSSLIYMTNELIEKSGHSQSGYYLNSNEKLFETLQELKSKSQKTILLGVSFALLDFTEKHSIDFPELIVMETGGMKGKRKELVRNELHQHLRGGFNIQSVHSEYGMTELLSQAYSHDQGKFFCPPWMKIFIRDINDPFSYLDEEKTGGINIIDLANINSCSFIATDDLGKLYNDNSFEVLGRFDHSDIRGCSLMVQ